VNQRAATRPLGACPRPAAAWIVVRFSAEPSRQSLPRTPTAPTRMSPLDSPSSRRRRIAGKLARGHIALCRLAVATMAQGRCSESVKRCCTAHGAFLGQRLQELSQDTTRGGLMRGTRARPAIPPGTQPNDFAKRAQGAPAPAGAIGGSPGSPRLPSPSRGEDPESPGGLTLRVRSTLFVRMEDGGLDLARREGSVPRPHWVWRARRAIGQHSAVPHGREHLRITRVDVQPADSLPNGRNDVARHFRHRV
jgi:hypothetical protein